MSDNDWDADDFEPSLPAAVPAVAIKSDKWDGEDEDEPVKANWEDDDSEKPTEEKTTSSVSTKKSAKKRLEEKIAERERKAREEAEQRRKESEANMTPEERMAEKLRLKKMVEEQDLALAMETFGVSRTHREGSIDDADPSTKEEFAELKSNLLQKLQSLKNKSCYNDFIEDFIKDVCISLEVDVLKKVSLTSKSLHEEKLKMAKAATKGAAKKGKTKVVLKMDKETENYGDDFGGGEYDDFM